MLSQPRGGDSVAITSTLGVKASEIKLLTIMSDLLARCDLFLKIKLAFNAFTSLSFQRRGGFGIFEWF